MTAPERKARIALAAIEHNDRAQQQARHEIRYPSHREQHRRADAIQAWAFIGLVAGLGLAASAGFGLLFRLLGIVG